MISLIFNLKPLIGAGLALLSPSFYLILREKKNLKKIFWAVLIFGGLFGFVFDFIETFNKAWIMEELVFPWKILGILPVDDILGFFMMTLLIVLFYEHFIDDEKDKRISKNTIFVLIPSILAAIAIVVLFSINPEILTISYAYLVGGIAAMIPLIIITILKPKLLRKFVYIAVPFFFLWFLWEMIALKTGGWIFTGQYIGLVTVFGLTFPVEELFFWTMMYSSSIVSYYEFFIDDLR